MSQNVIQPSFASGELAPSLFARVDLEKYHTGLALMRNCFVDVRGGATSRPGTMFVGQAYNSNYQVRLIPFQFSTLQTYVLEFGQYYMRIITNGAYLLENNLTISAATNANPGVFTIAGHGFSNGDWIYVGAMSGMHGLAGGTFIVQNVTTNTFTLTDLYGNVINTTASGAFVSGTVARYYTVASPYAAADLALLKFFQSADFLTICHPNYQPYDLERAGPISWSFNAVTFQPSVAAPGTPSVSASVTGHSTTYRYVVTTLGANGEESLSSSYGQVTNSDTMSQNVNAHVVVTWGAVAGALQYNIYRQEEVPGGAPDPSEGFGYVGYSNGTTFTDVNVQPDFTRTPPLGRNPLAGGNNPACGCYFQQRKIFGGSINNPETFYTSQPGNFTNMDVSNPTKDSDAITGTLAANQVNAIKHMVSVNTLIMLTSAGAWQVTGGGTVTGALTPSTITAQPQAYNGSSDVPPLVINYDILYVQSKGSIVRDLAYNFYVNLYTGTDLSTLSSHLFFGHQITEWCWAEEPFKTVWSVREDGQMLTLAFLKEQNVFGWSHQDTQGYYQSVCAVSEGNVDAVYFVVSRYINGRWLKYIERNTNRILLGNIENAWCVDAGLSYPLTYPNAGIYPPADTSGNPIPAGGTGTFTADAAIFSAGSVGSVLRVANGRATITQYIDSEHVVASITNPNTSTLYQASGTWSCTAPVETVSGLNHLEGATVQILADGNVQPPQVVTNGAVTLQHAATAIVVGLGFQCQVQTLYLDVGSPTIQGKRKKIAAVTLRLFESRGLKVGPSFTRLTEIKERTTQAYGQPIPLTTGDERVNIAAEYNLGGQVCVQQDYPLPFSLLGLIPEIQVGDT